MAETFAFELKLVDSISSSAKKATDALTKLDLQAKSAKSALNFGKDIGRFDAQFKKLSADPKGYVAMVKAQRALAESRKKLLSGAGMTTEPFFKRLGDEFSSKLSFGKLLGAAALADVMVEGAMKAVDVLTDGVKEMFSAGAKNERMGLAYKLSLGASGGKESREDVERFSKLTAYSTSENEAMMLPLRRSGMSQQAARQAMATAGDIEAGGGMSTPAALDALTKIQLKGGVSERQLTTGIGLNAQDFYKSLGSKLGVSSGTAKKMAANGGSVDPQLLINTISEGVNKKQGGPAGTGAKLLGKTMGAEWHKLVNLPEEYLKTMSTSPAWAKLEGTLGGLLDRLDPKKDPGKRIVDSLLENLGKVAKKADEFLTEENIDAFVAGLAKVPGVVNQIVKASEVLAAVWAGMKIVSTVDKVAKMLPGAATTLGTVARVAPTVAAASVPAAAALGYVGLHDTLLQGLDLKKASGELQGDLATGRKKATDHWWGTSYDDVSDPMEQQQAAKLYADFNAKAGNTVNLQVTNNVSVQAAPGESPDQTHKKMASDVGRLMQNAVEKSVSEAGG